MGFTHSGIRYILGTGVTAVLLALSVPAAAQTIQLLKDLQPGLVQNDVRTIVQIVPTTHTLYTVSGRRSDYIQRTRYYINSSNGQDMEQKIGFSLGSPVSFDSGYAPTDYPFFVVRDGKAVFSRGEDSSSFVELDGATGEVTRLTFDKQSNAAIATWIGADNQICFLRNTYAEYSFEIGFLDASSSTGLTITRQIPVPYDHGFPYGPPQITAVKVLGNTLLFAVSEKDFKKVTLWGTDGTAAGTEQLHSQASDSYINSNLILALGKCFFSVMKDASSVALHITDGTFAGTTLIDEAMPGILPGYRPYENAESSSTLYWLSSPYEGQIMYSDGLTTGVLPFDEDADLAPKALCWVEGKLYISTITTGIGPMYPGPLLVSDGVSTPTALSSGEVPMSSIYAKAETATGTYVYSDNTIYFVVGDVSNSQLIASFEQRDQLDSYTMAFFDGRIAYGAGTTVGNSDQLFISDPADPYHSHLLTQFTRTPISSDPGDFETAAQYSFFRNTVHEDTYPEQVYRTDGTAAGTVDLLPTEPVWLGGTVHGMLFYHKIQEMGFGGYYGDGQFFLSNGMPGAIPQPIFNSSDSHTGRPPTRLFTINGVSFIGGSRFEDEPILITSDGTPQGTSFVSQSFEPTNLEYPFHPIGVAGARGLYYARTTNTAVLTHEIWSSDGTAQGTAKISESIAAPTAGAEVPGGLIVYGAEMPGAGIEPMLSDGTSTGTKLLADIVPGASGSNARRFTSAGARAFFVADEPGGTWAVWATDGTEAGTTKLPPLNALVDEDEQFVMRASQHGGVYITGVHAGSCRLIYSDGPAAGTRVVAELPADAAPQMLAEVRGFLYLAMTTPDLGRELYRTVGYDGGLNLVQDFAPGRASGAIMSDAGVIGNKLIFAADPNDGVTGREPHYITVLDSKVADWQLY